MKTLSLILSILAIINLILVICTWHESFPSEYLTFGLAYAILHLVYQAIMGEGIFNRKSKNPEV